MSTPHGSLRDLRVLVAAFLVGAPVLAPRSAAAQSAPGATAPTPARTDAVEELVIARVLYLSRSSVYIDRGRADGLAEGTGFIVRRDGRPIAELEVVFLSNHSASCRVVSSEAAPVPGDEVLCPAVGQPAAARPLSAPPEPASPAPSRPRQPPPRDGASGIRGSAALEWNTFFDGDDTDAGFHHPSLYLRLDGDGVSGRPIDVNVHLRSDYLERSRPLRGRRADEWVHRVYRASLTWRDASLPFRLSVGRLHSGALRGVGVWDGGLLEIRHAGWRFGVLGGSEAAPLDREYDFGRRKYGAYVTLENGRSFERRYRGTVGFVGQYEDGALSREFAICTHEIAAGRRLRFRQDLELDLNRGWRREALRGNPTTLSRLNLLLNGQVSARMRVHVGYDYFRNVRRLSTRYLPEELFFDPRLQGLRLGTSWRVSGGCALRGHIGIRDREHEDRRPVFAGASASWTDLLGSRTHLRIRYSYSDGRLAKSHAPALDVRRSLGSVVHAGIGVGAQFWDEFRRESLAVDGTWTRFFGTWAVARRVDLQWMAMHSIGEIGPGTRGHLRLAHRF